MENTTLNFFLESLPSRYYSLKTTGTIVIIFYNIVMDAIVTYLGPISCPRDGGAHYSQLT